MVSRTRMGMLAGLVVLASLATVSRADLILEFNWSNAAGDNLGSAPLNYTLGTLPAGTELYFQVKARPTGVDGTTTTSDDRFQSLYWSLLSNTGGPITGSISLVSYGAGYTTINATPKQQDIDGDGDLDLGFKAGGLTADYLYWRSGTKIAGTSVLLGLFKFTVTGASAGQTTLSGVTRPASSGGIWDEDNVQKTPVTDVSTWQNLAINVTGPTTTATSYSLSLNSLSQTAMFVGDSLTVNSVITNVGTGTADTLNFTTLGLSVSGIGSGTPSGQTSGGPVANGGGTGTANLSFLAATAGTATLTASVGSATNATLGGAATLTTAGSANITIYLHASPTVTATQTLTLPDVIVGYSGPVAGTSTNLGNANGSIWRVAMKTTGTVVDGNVSINNVAGVGQGSSASVSASLAAGQGVGPIASVFSLVYADDSSVPGASGNLGGVTVNVTGNVLDHADGALDGLNSRTLNVGNRLGRSGGLTVQTVLSNASGNRARLQIVDLGGLSGASVGDKILAGGNTTLSKTFNAPFGVDSFFDVFVTDDQSVPGASTGNEHLQLTVTGRYASAVAPAGGFGANTLTSGPLGDGANLAGLYSVVDTANGAVGTLAEILYGTLPTGGEVTMNWRQYNAADRLQLVVSDVVDLNGTGSNVYVLQMSYNPADPFIGGENNARETQLANNGALYLAWLSGGLWVNAGDLDQYQGVGAYAGQTAVGDWGVDVVNNKVWAVLNHNSSFAVVPEPATLAFLMLGGLTMATAGVMRKRRQS